MKKIVLMIVALGCATAVATATEPTLFEALAAPDSATQANVVVHQDSIMRAALEAQQVRGNETTMRGFRVQLFSSNNARTAREAAFKVEKTIREKLPHMAVYVTYTSPFWRVRVGNCPTHDDAQRLRQYLIEQLPQLSTETYIVPDQILLNQ
ncbi:MAG: SPOR domain-containing protein [Paludibacteraceae bacterium]|nr:SPOR domain-containing protein [Bacteroidales bacterium]MDY4850823.1 SPOR domain-containing protein [Paludibacteraceae bacterium]MDY6037108.1 SPOR domain-containing protein [Paludibacteraceae bacterium]